jgi:hypothetical protein
MYRLICRKPAHFLSAQMALVSTFFQIFIVLGMYNFALLPKCAEFKNTCYVISEFYLKFNKKVPTKLFGTSFFCIFEFIYSEKATIICQNLPVDLTFTKFRMEG